MTSRDEHNRILMEAHRNEAQDKEIERLNARIKDYQDACHQKQEIINGLQEDNERLQARVKELETKKDGAYLERNQCVALIARMAIKLGCRVTITKTDIEGWSEDWHGCIRIDLPTGQVSWHFHDSQKELFTDFPKGNMEWDGHDTQEKYRRVNEAYK